MGIFAKLGLIVLALLFLFFVAIPFIKKKMTNKKKESLDAPASQKACDCGKPASTAYPMVGGTVISLGNQSF